jgi:hypothetical protein
MIPNGKPLFISLHTSIHGRNIMRLYLCLSGEYIGVIKVLPHQARIPDEIYAELYRIKQIFDQSLISCQSSETLSYQDIVNVALRRLIADWKEPEKQDLLRDELLGQRNIARKKMGRKKSDSG